MRIYHRTGPGSGISYGLGEGCFFWFLVFLGAFPFVILWTMVYLAVWALAIVLIVLLALNGIIYHAITGKDARIPVPGSEHGAAIEYWMEGKGWIRLPSRMHTPSIFSSSMRR